jgi:hypothetical protein
MYLNYDYDPGPGGDQRNGAGGGRAARSPGRSWQAAAHGPGRGGGDPAHQGPGGPGRRPPHSPHGGDAPGREDKPLDSRASDPYSFYIDLVGPAF